MSLYGGKGFLFTLILMFLSIEVCADISIVVDTQRYMTNIYEDGLLLAEQRSIIGKTSTPTPALVDEITHVILNPTWTVPPGIKKRIEEKGTFDSFGFVVKDDKWIQPSGPGNVMGLVKFRMTNDKLIYIHGTNQPFLFDKEHRRFSAGCVRIEDPISLAERLLPNIDIKSRIGGKEKWIKLSQSVPVEIR